MFDVIVIGGGPGGYVAAIKAAQSGLKTALMEKSELGGVCLNRGCIPTKSLLHAAGALRNMKEASAMGLQASDIGFDYAKIVAIKDSQVKTLTNGIQYLLNKNGVTVFSGQADIVSTNTVTVAGQKLDTRYIIIAAGSSPVKPPIPGINHTSVITSDEALALTRVPASMAIIGGGVIGIEMAFAFQSFGCSVAMIEMEPQIAPLMDADISKGLSVLLKKQGIQIYTGTKVQEIRQDSVLCSKGSENIRIPAQKVLVATGRTANGQSLSLDKLGIAHQKGIIGTDVYLRTNIPNIFAIGDVNGKYMLAHVASAEGIRAVGNITGKARPMDYSAIPQCIYTEPEAACVGLTEAEALNQRLDFKVSHVQAAANGKSLIDGCTKGFVKIIAEKKNGRLLGVHILAPHASEMLAQCTAAIRFRATAKELEEVIFPHPSVSELIAEVVHGIDGKPLHA
jgi:dihydrolipoamide dehydrogenase